VYSGTASPSIHTAPIGLRNKGSPEPKPNCRRVGPLLRDTMFLISDFYTKHIMPALVMNVQSQRTAPHFNRICRVNSCTKSFNYRNWKACIVVQVSNHRHALQAHFFVHHILQTHPRLSAHSAAATARSQRRGSTLLQKIPLQACLRPPSPIKPNLPVVHAKTPTSTLTSESVQFLQHANRLTSNLAPQDLYRSSASTVLQKQLLLHILS
jgi:hypothetical protein